MEYGERGRGGQGKIWKGEEGDLGRWGFGKMGIWEDGERRRGGWGKMGKREEGDMEKGGGQWESIKRGMSRVQGVSNVLGTEVCDFIFVGSHEEYINKSIEVGG